MRPRNPARFSIHASHDYRIKGDLKNRMYMAKKIKTILISQPKPATEKSPYFDLADKMKLTIDFRPFIHVEAIDASEFRQQKVDISEY